MRVGRIFFFFKGTTDYSMLRCRESCFVLWATTNVVCYLSADTVLAVRADILSQIVSVYLLLVYDHFWLGCASNEADWNAWLNLKCLTFVEITLFQP